MKFGFKGKILAVSIALIGVAAPAHAIPQATASTGGGLFVTVWDTSKQQTFGEWLGLNDLTTTGLTFANFNTNLSQTWNLGTPFTALGFSSATTRWWVGASGPTNPPAQGYTTYAGTGSAPVFGSGAAAANATTSINTQAAFNDGFENTAGGGSVAVGGSSWSGVGFTDDGYAANSPPFGNNLGGSALFTSSGTGFGSNMSFMSFTGTNSSKLAGIWSLASNGALTYTVSDVAPIPEPSSIMLMVAGLLGLGAMARRRLS